MDDVHLTLVEGYRYNGGDVDLSTEDFWTFALEQRYFGPRRVIVVTACPHGGVLGLAHCQRTDPPEMALKCCLASLDDGAAAAIVYSDEPVAVDPPGDLRERFDVARAAAAEYGVHLVDWLMCDDTHLRSMRVSLDEPEYRWEPRAGGPPANGAGRLPRRFCTRRWPPGLA